MLADRCRSILSHYIGRCGLEPPSQMGARLQGRVIRLGVDLLGPWWTRSLVEIPTLIGQAYPMLE
jgi:hypothetical protein